MTTTLSFKSVALALVGAAALFAVAAPAFSYAANYAYVNAQGEVRMVTAPDPMTAINTAPNIHMRSGVMLLDSQADEEVVGDRVGM